MKIISFVKSLLPRIGKDQILEDIRVTSGELEQIVLPNYKHAADYFRINKTKSAAVKELSEAFYDRFDKGSIVKQSSIVGEVAVRLGFIQDNLNYVQAQIDELMERDVINEGLTAKKSILVRAADQISFISRFASDVLNYIYVQEAIEFGADTEESMQLAPAVQKNVVNGIKLFAAYISDYGIPNKEFEKLVLSVPDIVISSRNENSIIGMYKEREIDPFNSAYVQGFNNNPIYHLRLVFAEWQSSRYKATKEKKKLLELRLLHLKLLQEKKADSKVEAEINYIQSRVDRSERYMRDVEESVEMA